MRDLRTNVAFSIFTILPVLTGLTEIRASLGHLQQDPWPPHALFHIIMGLGCLLAADGLIVFLTWGPLRRGQRWAWFAIGFAAFAIHGGQIIGDLLTGGGLRNQSGIVASGSVLFTAIVIAVFLYVVGLVLSWHHTRRSDALSHS